MHKIADVEIAKNIMDANDRLAHKNLHLLEDHDIFCIDFVGAIGSGKTALIEDLIGILVILRYVILIILMRKSVYLQEIS